MAQWWRPQRPHREFSQTGAMVRKLGSISYLHPMLTRMLTDTVKTSGVGFMLVCMHVRMYALRMYLYLCVQICDCIVI